MCSKSELDQVEKVLSGVINEISERSSGSNDGALVNQNRNGTLPKGEIEMSDSRRASQALRNARNKLDDALGCSSNLENRTPNIPMINEKIVASVPNKNESISQPALGDQRQMLLNDSELSTAHSVDSSLIGHMMKLTVNSPTNNGQELKEGKEGEKGGDEGERQSGSNDSIDDGSSLSTDTISSSGEGDDESFNTTINDDDHLMRLDSEALNAYFFRLPRAYKYADYIWPGMLMSPQRIRDIRHFNLKSNDILICSYPKSGWLPSGTTWISEMVSLIVNGGDLNFVGSRPLHERVPWLELDDNYYWVQFFRIWHFVGRYLGLIKAENEESSDDQGDSPRVIFTHLPLELLPSQAIDGKCKIIYISRNPKDNAVSFFHFHQMARFLGQQNMSWDEFFPLYMTGKIYCGSWFEHVLSFWKMSQDNPNMLFLKYEDMKKDLGDAVDKVCSFLSMELDEETRDVVIDHSQFESMKGNSMANRDGVWLFNQKKSRFMRKGIVGDWENYFSVAQSKRFDEVYADRMMDTGLDFEFK